MRRWFVVVLLLILPFQAYSAHYQATVQDGLSALVRHEVSQVAPADRSSVQWLASLQNLSSLMAETAMQDYVDHADTPLPSLGRAPWRHAWPPAFILLSLPAISCEFTPERRPPRA
ncbi:hypothetical protein [Alcaligenes sp. SDU_A2]|uniref:hypothetical protein n=1 Tax=Alcaligenes sp. SDU_A2 TaxID=3136634 RepID=UPI002C8AAE13|nr:hypothetical protein [Alcaligenes sp.]HRL28231.1 hypothetical protein [Alcaligenes sp.]